MRKYTYGFLLALFLCSFFAQSQQKDQLNLESYFGDLRARHIGPALMSGRINDLELHPTNPRILYAGTAGGGVWKSNNGGATFNPIFDDHIQSIGAVTLDPNDPDNTIYVGTGETWTRNSVSVGDGLYKSVDGGINWDKIGFENSERIANVIVNPNNSDEIFVGVLGALWSDSDERGVYKSEDGGKTWAQVLYDGPSTGCADLAMDPTNPNILYASMWEFRRTGWSFNSGGEKSALYKSIDGGKTWSKIHNGFPEGKLGRLAIAIAPSSPNILYTVIEAEKQEQKGLYKSLDGGNSWTQSNNDFGITVRPFYFSRIVVDPTNPDVILKAGLSGSISRDGGETFKDLGVMHSDIHDLAFNIEDSDNIYAGTDGGVYRSWNGGTTFEIVENLPLSQFYHISVDNEEPYNVYGGLQDNGSWYGPNLSGGGVTAADWKSVGAGDGFRVLSHPTKRIIYSEMQGAENIWRYDTEKQRVKTIHPLPKLGQPKLRFNWNTPIEISYNQPDRLYVGSQFLHVSDDMGESWRTISEDLTTNNPEKQNQQDSGGLSMDNSGAENHTTIFTIAESKLDENVIWVGTDDGNVQVTRNGGKTWTNTVKNISGLPENTWAYHIEVSVHDKGTAYAVFDGHTRGDFAPYVYKTTDYGVTWNSIVTDDIPIFARNIQEDYVNPNLLFLGTEKGLFITNNGGESWSHFTKNMPPVAVHYIELQSKTNDLVMGTHGRGVIILDDISPLREINSDQLSSKLHFFEPTGMLMSDKSYGFGSSFGAETQFVGENPTTIAQFKYLLPKRHTFGKMTMEIHDLEGNVISKLSPGKSKGVNIVRWNYTMKQPKVAKGKTLAFGGFTSPRVLAGTYKVVINKGRDKFEWEFELTNDPTTSVDTAYFKQKNDIVMSLYDLTQDLAYMVYQVDEMIEGSQGKLKSKLMDLKKTLVITTGDNYVGAAEPELREKLANLYSKVADSYSVPSPNEMEYMEVVLGLYSTAEKEFNRLKKKSKISFEELKSFDEFLNE
ncbi:MAG: hypothetical protein CMC18_08460 [Flavobacteriaceae bacterium]|nr:hypothetical protein [Flavobacteriaceae bacterium]